ncbi:ankyrin repeat domain-containing protein 12-like isoform X2 [Coccinella septempunctata]|uniref:ankyrin repeat domain-containing protein 12-like isoform X2 n=1 Tax=Coccinella septempunctata TaxID=41139 RepID=UPI001D06987D|nr:ankyrin repeat domain-containing protein 12-like isoform X2 [Coccinella septempunctata]
MMFATSCGFRCCGGETEQEEEEVELNKTQVDMSDDSRNSQKITGYLEKRGKLKLMNSWKRYWFVLEGHLLLYYGSKEEYDALSPCKGTITLGPTCTIKPYQSTPSKFQITTRSGCAITLRAESVAEQNKWMQAVYSTVNENQKIDISPTKLCHFRYSTERVDTLATNADQQKSDNIPVPTEAEPSPTRTLEKDEGQLLERLQRIGARSYCENIVSNHQKIVNKTTKPKKLDLTSNDKVLTNEVKSETATVSPRRLQFSPKIPKITEEPTATKEEMVILEDDDYCVCTLDKNEEVEVPKNSPTTSHRSISFSDAREVFNRSQANNTSTKIRNKNSSESNVSERNHGSPKVPGKMRYFNRENSKIMEIKEDNNNNPNKEVEEKSEEEKLANSDGIAENEKPESMPTDKEPQQNTQKLEDASSGNQENLDLRKNEKQSSRISLLGNYYETEPEKPTSYQDFRENELYVKKLEKSNEISEPNEELYSEPKSFEDATTRRENPEFKFPPPPFEAYASIDDLTSDEITEDDEYLYEEPEDFIWQNEIYEPSINQNEQITKIKDIKKPFRTDVDIDDDLYEEVDMDFVYKKSIERGKDSFEVPAKPRSESEESDMNMYEEVDFKDNSRMHRQVSGVQMENDLYAETEKENPLKDFKYHHPKHAENDRKLEEKTKKDSYNQSHAQSRNEVQIENDLYSEPTKLFDKDQKSTLNPIEQRPSTKELQIENEIYAEPNQVFGKMVSLKTDKTEVKDEKHISAQEFQMENDLYSEPNIISEKTNKFQRESSEDEAFYTEPDFKPIFSRQNSRTEKGTMDKTYTDKQRNFKFRENELYSQPNSEELDEERRSVEFDEEINVYEDPDQLKLMSQIKEKKKKLQKSEELKKQDNFIQRLLKQVTRKHGEKSDKGSSCDNADETLALLADIQVLLEKKKQYIKEMVTSGSKPNHRRILSETNATVENKDKCLNEEYSVVRDCIGDENEVIYSEVEMMDRSSKELKDIIEDLLSRYKTNEQKESDFQPCTEKD